MTPPVVSIVIPCYRQGHFLAGAIDAALDQSYPRVEVVVVNDGSDDETDAVAGRYAGRIRYVRQHNQGLSAARNAGVAAATGQYLLVLDSDDLLHPDAVAWLVEAADGRDEILCVAGFRRFDADPAAGSEQLPPVAPPPAATLLRTNLGPPHCYLSSRSMVARAGGFDVGLRSCEDWDMWLRLVFAGAELIPVRRVTALYRQHPESMSRNVRRMAQTRIAVMTRVMRQADADPAGIRRLGADPAALRRALTGQISDEYFDAGYHLREQGELLPAIRLYALSGWWGKRRRALLGLSKLVLRGLTGVPAAQASTSY